MYIYRVVLGRGGSGLYSVRCSDTVEVGGWNRSQLCVEHAISTTEYELGKLQKQELSVMPARSYYVHSK